MAIKGLRAWVHKLAQIEMPALGNVITELNTMTGNDDTDASELAEVILKDANLTSQVLRIANSVQFNPTGTPLTTVSRAIVLVGFRGIRDICLSVSIIDSLLGDTPREHLLGVMAKGFHSGTQARWISPDDSREASEEVFVAALLQRLGEMAFWAYGGEAADELAAAMEENPDANQEELEKSILGVSLKTMSRGLCELWQLGDVLQDSLAIKPSQSEKAQTVRLAAEISDVAQRGWAPEETEQLLAKIASFTGDSIEEAREAMLEATEEAASVALKFGATQICHLIAPPKAPAEPLPQMVGNPQLQLSVLRELTSAVSEKLSISTVFQMAAEGIHRGIGLERVAVVFISKQAAVAKYALGDGTETWRDKFRFPVTANDSNLFTHALQEGHTLLLEDAETYGAAFRQIVGSQPALVAPINLGNRTVAFFYADRANRGGCLTEEMKESFQHFGLQTQMTLTMLAQQSH